MHAFVHYTNTMRERERALNHTYSIWDGQGYQKVTYNN